MLLKPEEKLDSMSCLAYMAPFSSALMLVMCFILEPTSLGLMVALPFEDYALVSALLLNCLAAFASNYFNMVVTKRTSALTIQVCPWRPALERLSSEGLCPGSTCCELLLLHI